MIQLLFSWQEKDALCSIGNEDFIFELFLCHWTLILAYKSSYLCDQEKKIQEWLDNKMFTLFYWNLDFYRMI